jgi:hypothetical protein
MTKKTITLRLKAIKPRNPLAVLGRRRSAGRHGSGDQRQQGKQDLARRVGEQV